MEKLMTQFVILMYGINGYDHFYLQLILNVNLCSDRQELKSAIQNSLSAET